LSSIASSMALITVKALIKAVLFWIMQTQSKCKFKKNCFKDLKKKFKTLEQK
jgi:hypothetical protein